MRTLPPTYGCPVSPTDPVDPHRPAATRAAAGTPAAVAWARGARALGALAAVTLAVLVAGAGADPAGAVPSTVLPAGEAEGGDVTIEPSVVRAPEGHAELDVVLGPRAPGDVVVELTPTVPVVATDGTVTPGARAEGVQVTTGARLRPGERLRVQVTTAGDPVVVVAHVSAATTTATGAADEATSETDDDADDADGDGPVELAALVLPGTTGPAPAVAVEVVDGQLRGTVTAAQPLLVSARLAGARTTTHPDRLVLPGQPVVLDGAAPARWPSPSVLTVTDEVGRTVTADTGRVALVAIATALLATAALAAVLAVRRRRAHTG